LNLIIFTISFDTTGLCLMSDTQTHQVRGELENSLSAQGSGRQSNCIQTIDNIAGLCYEAAVSTVL